MKRIAALLFVTLVAGLALGQSADPIEALVFPPELVMRHQQAIGLSDDQKQSLRDDMRKTQLTFTELQWDLQDAMEAFGKELGQPKVDEGRALELLGRVLDAEREIKRTQVGLLVRIKNALTPEQQARLDELRDRN